MTEYADLFEDFVEASAYFKQNTARVRKFPPASGIIIVLAKKEGEVYTVIEHESF